MLKICRILLGLLIFTLFAVVAHAEVEIEGSGATFPMPVIKKWAEAYQAQKNIKVIYTGTGSAEGIRRITARTVDFAVTDIGLTLSELNHDDLLQAPLVAGGITPVINLPQVTSGQVRLSGQVLADIFMGEITYWDEGRVQKMNPGIKLPHIPIMVIHRQDGSGTTFTFTNYLSKVSPVWNKTLGIGSSLVWPAGEGAKGNDGVAQKVAETNGAIGYVEFIYAEKYHLTTVDLINHDGALVSPTLESAQSAFAKSHWHKSSFYQSATDVSGAYSWPIVAISYVLMHKTNNDRDDALQTIHFLEWIYTNGPSVAKDSGYIFMTNPELLKAINETFKQVKDAQGNPILR